MLSEEQHILIDKFFSGELTVEEQQAFESLLRDDAAFRAEVDLQQQVIAGISAYGATQLKAELKDIHKEVQGDLNNYKPTKGGGGLETAIKWLITLGVLGAAVYYGYRYYTAHKAEIDQKIEKSAIEMIEVKRDTVWHTVPAQSSTRIDTVIYGEEAMQEYLKAHPNAKPNSKRIIRLDTIR